MTSEVDSLEELDELCEDLEAELEEQERSEGSSSDLEILEVRDRSVQPEASAASSRNLKTLRCPICLETPTIVAVAACGHAYCHECVFTALSSSRRSTLRDGECSLCRKRVRYDQTLYMEVKIGKPPGDADDSVPNGGSVPNEGSSDADKSTPTVGSARNAGSKSNGGATKPAARSAARSAA